MGTANPLIVRVASPDPTDPRMKLESRAWMTASGLGYTTEIEIGPTMLGTGGRGDAAGLAVEGTLPG
jgi:hypothetical protein